MTALKATFTILAVLALFALVGPSQAELAAYEEAGNTKATCFEAHGG